MAFESTGAFGATGAIDPGVPKIGVGGATGRARRGRVDGPVFQVLSDPPEGASGAEAAGDVAGLPEISLTSMLALQEIDQPTVADRRARRHADGMLEALRALQLALLAGEDGADGLQRLAGLLGAVPVATDAGLRGAVAALALRIELELVRHASQPAV